MQHDPGIRVYGLDEDPDFIAISKEQARWIRLLATLASEEEGEPTPYTDEEQRAGRLRVAAYEKDAGDLNALESRVRSLGRRDIEVLLALVELLEFGDAGLEHGSWVLSIVRDLLHRVAWLGPGPANELPFAQTLLQQTEAWEYFIDWINDARKLARRYPKLLPLATVGGHAETKPENSPALPALLFRVE